MRLIAALLVFAGGAQAQDIVGTAQTLYPQMPEVAVVERIAGNCGADAAVNPRVAYCTSENRIYVAEGILADRSAPYEIAHQFGHAIFVQHGLADVALAAIRANRGQEAFLRGQVSRQIDCLAGVLYARAGYPTGQLTDWFDAEPFTGAHWGRDPLRVGPKASISLAARDEWFQKGQMAGEPTACEVPELPVELLITPFRG